MEKLKTIKDTVKDNDWLIKSEDIMIDNDKSGACIIVNKVENDDRGKSDTASSSDSELEEGEE